MRWKENSKLEMQIVCLAEASLFRRRNILALWKMHKQINEKEVGKPWHQDRWVSAMYAAERPLSDAMNAEINTAKGIKNTIGTL